MKVIVAGGRDFNDRHQLYNELPYFVGYGDHEIISGHAKGADRIGEDFAEEFHIPCLKFPADWEKYGKAAGYRRNAEMAKYADTLIAFWDGSSKGTKSMISIALKVGLEVHVYRYTGDTE